VKEMDSLPSNQISEKEILKQEIDEEEDDTELLDELENENDPVFQRIREERLQEMKKKMTEMERMKGNAYGIYSELEREKDFLAQTTSIKNIVCHFYHKEFSRCRIVDKHLAIIAQKYPHTKFVKINVEIAPFFVEKLQIKILPCIVCFIDGVAQERIVGFADLGERDDFPTGLLEKRLARSGIITLKEKEIKRTEKRSIYESEHNKMNDDNDDLSD